MQSKTMPEQRPCHPRCRQSEIIGRVCYGASLARLLPMRQAKRMLSSGREGFGEHGRTQGCRGEVHHDAQGEPGLVDAGVVPVAVQDAVGDQVEPAQRRETAIMPAACSISSRKLLDPGCACQYNSHTALKATSEMLTQARLHGEL